MTDTPLWSPETLAEAAGGVWDQLPTGPLTSFSLDSRMVGAGDVFVALKSNRDGHDFVPMAFDKGAGAALVSTAYVRQQEDGALLRVDDTLTGLERIGVAARGRLSADAFVLAVTGSVGKTGTKEMLRLAFTSFGSTHAPEKSFNNHWGVPLTLARMPKDTAFGVFEIGMNHPGEITPLSRMVHPQAAIVTTVAPVHLGQFSSVDEIAAAKAEIFEGLGAGGVAILNRDNAYFAFLADRAGARQASVLSFGRDAKADCRLLDMDADASGSLSQINVAGQRIELRLRVPGAHLVHNALAVLLAVHVAGRDVRAAASALEAFAVPEGRGVSERLTVDGGQVLLIDESYNANPASMSAALSVLGLPREGVERRIAVVGDMLELGETGPDLHAALAHDIETAGIDCVFACGPLMSHLHDALGEDRRGGYAESAEHLTPMVLNAIRPGDAVMIKGSLGSRMGPLLAALKSHLIENQRV